MESQPWPIRRNLPEAQEVGELNKHFRSLPQMVHLVPRHLPAKPRIQK